MTDTTKDIWNDDDEEKQPVKKPHRLRRFLIFFLTLVVVLGAVVLAAYRDGTGFDVLRRYFSYGSADSASGTGYSYDASSNNRFGVLGDRLVVLSNTALKVLKDDGTEAFSTSVKMANPALNVDDGLAVAVDVGGTSLIVVDQNGEKLNLTADEDEPFIAATLNADGYLAVTSEKKNYKGAVSVYNSKQELVFSFQSSTRFVTDAYVTDDDKTLAAVTLGQTDSVFVSNIVLYDLSDTEPRTNYDLSDGLVLSIGELSGRLTTICDTGIFFAGSDGKLDGTYSYDSEFLREYAMGDGCAALLLNRYRSGSMGRLVTVNSSGAEMASLDISEEVLSLSAAGHYIAVLYADKLVIYTDQLEEYATLSGTEYAKSVIMRSDGSALIAASDKATLFLP